MAQKYTYKLINVQEREDLTIDDAVEQTFDQLQELGWEYVSGPTIDKYTDSFHLLFLVKRPKSQESAYKDRGLLSL